MGDIDWEIIYKGNLIAVERHKVKGFERAIRPPGVRVILKVGDKIVLTREYRVEHGTFDYRLPGGKVFDTLEEYLQVRGSEDLIIKSVLHQAEIEAKQETGAKDLSNISLLKKVSCGATIEWDLYYVVGAVSSFGEQALHGDEQIHGIEVGSYSKQEIQQLLDQELIQEDRTFMVLNHFIKHEFQK